MVTTKALFCTAALLLVVAMVNIERAEAQCGGFRDSCKNFGITNNGVFFAQCNDKRGIGRSVSINLNSYISNIDGDLFVPGASFSKTCDGLGYSVGGVDSGLYILAGCAQDDGTTALAAFDINTHISNDNGVLNWHVC